MYFDGLVIVVVVVGGVVAVVVVVVVVVVLVPLHENLCVQARRMLMALYY